MNDACVKQTNELASGNESDLRTAQDMGNSAPMIWQSDGAGKTTDAPA